LVNTFVACGINMFNKMVDQLRIQTLGKGKKDFKITKQEFEDFCKGFLFEQIKGDLKLGDAFCKKYNEPNYVLSILPDDSAREHIRKFYVK
jgi:hypothetical protein